jgi:hypothetical protein
MTMFIAFFWCLMNKLWSLICHEDPAYQKQGLQLLSLLEPEKNQLIGWLSSREGCLALWRMTNSQLESKRVALISLLEELPEVQRILMGWVFSSQNELHKRSAVSQDTVHSFLKRTHLYWEQEEENRLVPGLYKRESGYQNWLRFYSNGFLTSVTTQGMTKESVVSFLKFDQEYKNSVNKSYGLWQQRNGGIRFYTCWAMLSESGNASGDVVDNVILRQGKITPKRNLSIGALSLMNGHESSGRYRLIEELTDSV